MAKLPNIRIDIASVFKDKGFKQATTASEKLSATFKGLGKQLGLAFSLTAVARFAQVSTRAFMDKQKETAQLTTALEGLNQAFRVPEVDAFLDKLEDLYKVGGDQLVPAFSQLARATEDVEQAQNLLNLSLDVAAGTGKDLQTVTGALSRAMAGNTGALGKLNVGLDKNLLKYGQLDDILDILQGKFEGSAARAVNTYEGQIKTLAVAADRAKETIGEGLVDAIGILGGQEGITGAADEMARLADETANAIRGFAALSRSMGITKGEGFGITDIAGAIPVAGAYLGPALQSLIKKGQKEALEKTLATAPVLDVEKEIAAARNRAKIQAALDRANKNQLAIEKAKTKEKEKQSRLDKVKSILDLEKIQIEAALKGRITEEEKVRLQLMKAIANENVDRAEILAEKLKKIQDDTAKLVTDLTEFPAAKDPFAEWTKTLSTVQAQLTAMAQKKIVIDFLANFTPVSTAPITKITQDPITKIIEDVTKSFPEIIAKEGEGNLLSGDAAAAAAEAAAAAAEAEKAQADAAAALAAAKTEEEKAAAEAFKKAADESAAAAAAQAEAAAALDYAAARAAEDAAAKEAAAAAALAEALAAEAAAREAAAALLDSGLVLDDSIMGAYASGVVPEVNITVNVAGNVTAEQDLAETVYETFLGYQKSGKGLLYSSTVI